MWAMILKEHEESDDRYKILYLQVPDASIDDQMKFVNDQVDLAEFVGEVYSKQVGEHYIIKAKHLDNAHPIDIAVIHGGGHLGEMVYRHAMEYGKEYASKHSAGFIDATEKA